MHRGRMPLGPFAALVMVSGLALRLVPALVSGPPTSPSPKPIAAASAVGPLLPGNPAAPQPPSDDATATPLEPAHVQESPELAPPTDEDFLTPEQVAALQPPIEVPPAKVARLAWPVAGRVTSYYGWRWGHREFHTGIDVAAPYGTVVRAAASGVVTMAGWYYGYGRAVLIRHADGLETLYGHNSKLLVSPGDRVERGQPIALSGSSGRSTGPHVHFEVRLGDRPVNPLRYLP